MTWTIAIVIWAIVLIELAMIGRWAHRRHRRDRERNRAWRESPQAIPRRDLRREYHQ